jgi:uncharacterized protein (DUF2267 family)
MQYQEFVQRVQSKAGLSSHEEALHTIKTTLATLGERLYRTERQKLAAQLPTELKGLLSERVSAEATRQDVDRFPLEEFYNRVSARLDISYDQAAGQSQAVASVLQQAVSPDQIRAVKDTLSADYETLFTGGSQGT